MRKPSVLASTSPSSKAMGNTFYSGMNLNPAKRGHLELNEFRLPVIQAQPIIVPKEFNTEMLLQELQSTGAQEQTGHQLPASH